MNSAYPIDDTRHDTDLPDEAPAAEIITTNSYLPFEQAVIERVRQRFADVGMPEDFTERFGPAFAMAMDTMLAKFAKGQEEHGGDIRDRDLRSEMTNEINDLMLYNIADKVKGTGVICYA